MIDRIKSAEDLRQLDILGVPVWIFELEQNRVWWANSAALQFWRAESLDDLRARDFSSDTPTVRTRLRQVLETAAPGSPVRETWTLYPAGEPVPITLIMTPVRVDQDARDALLIEGAAIDSAPDRAADRRLLEAARYTTTMITYFTVDGDLVAMNPAAANACGPPKTGGAPFIDRFADGEAARALFADGVGGANPWGQFQVETVDGARWHRVDLRLSRDPVTGDYTVLAVEEDVSSLKQALLDLEALNQDLEAKVAERTAALMEALEHADRANAAKSAFLAQMSHELRTPMNAILGFSEVVRDARLGGDIDTRYRGYAADIFDSGSHLLSLINDVLDLSKVEAGMYQVSKRTIDVSALLDSITTLFEAETERERIRLDATIVDGTAEAVVDDRIMRQILINVISNALKFTGSDGLVSVHVTGSPPTGLAATISDTGIGMTEEQVAVALSPFGQVDAMRHFDKPGTGLGLPVSKELAELHGGSLTVSSTPGKGTVVQVVLA